MTTEKWRSLTDDDRHEFWQWLSRETQIASARGKESYPEPLFQGDPLTHAAEELIDGLFYVFYAKRQLEEERANRPPYMSKLGDLLQKLVWYLQSGVIMKEATIDLDGITFKVIGSRLDYGDRPFDFKIMIMEQVNG